MLLHETLLAIDSRMRGYSMSQQQDNDVLVSGDADEDHEVDVVVVAGSWKKSSLVQEQAHVQTRGEEIPLCS
jgi:hypothetical protein